MLNLKLTQIIYASVRSFKTMNALHTLIKDGWRIIKVEDNDKNGGVIETYKYTLERYF